jgi:hypothetical protein
MSTRVHRTAQPQPFPLLQPPCRVSPRRTKRQQCTSGANALRVCAIDVYTAALKEHPTKTKWNCGCRSLRGSVCENLREKWLSSFNPDTHEPQSSLSWTSRERLISTIPHQPPSPHFFYCLSCLCESNRVPGLDGAGAVRCSPFIRSAIDAILRDSFTKCFESKERERWDNTFYLFPVYWIGLFLR